MIETRMTAHHRGNAGNARKLRAAASTALMALAICAAAAASGTKSVPVFFPEEARARLRANAGQTAWGENIRRTAVDAARPWLEMSDEGLWDLMFGATITRSWMVWSNGHCPSCKNPVPMYSWKVDALKMPWKMACPHCGRSTST